MLSALKQNPKPYPKACARMVGIDSRRWAAHVTNLFLGKQWHAPRKAFRPSAGLTSYEQREKRRLAMSVTKAKEKEMKEEKEAERQVRPAFSA
ncbi:hypothetical protein RRF57_000363 [Xylaria bambusicola]|uniref:rRNA-processing protein n=1 Tax=Xylaria bambusicola TaxID=326684 RepID=A0AAN7YZK1_9PEZI